MFIFLLKSNGIQFQGGSRKVGGRSRVKPGEWLK